MVDAHDLSRPASTVDANSSILSELDHHYDTSALVQAPVERVFDHVDDHARLSSHMSQASWMMGGGSMRLELDVGRWQSVGSRIRLAGRIFGIELAVEEIVTERNPPRRKVWQTTGTPRILVIGHYRMGFEITPNKGGAVLCVFIDYALPEGIVKGWLGRLFGGYYARWCAQRMVEDTVRHFRAIE